MTTTRHGSSIGAALGNVQPDETTVPGILRAPGVLLQFGDLETQFGIQAEPLAVFERQRGHTRIVTTFTHEEDAERYLLTFARPEAVPEPWDDARVRYTWPDDVQVDVDVAKLNVAWEARDGTHRMSTVDASERKTLCMAAWARNVSIPELLARVGRASADETDAEREV